QDRFYTIIISESLHLIWKIQHDSDLTKLHSDLEIVNRWNHVINFRLRLDCLITNHRHGRRTLTKEKVLQTWSKVLRNELHLPDDWTENTEVLVGSGRLRPPGRNR
ncbi:hypothetical protein M378DRAFT_84228, partial [Amanita muscaria Koide BX008]